MVWILITQNFWIARACQGGHLLRTKKTRKYLQTKVKQQTNNKAIIPFITHKHPKSYVTSFYILHFASPSELQGGCTNPLSIENDGLLENAWICYVLKKLLENAKTFFWRGGTRPHGGTHFLDRQNSRTFFLGSKKARRWHI